MSFGWWLLLTLAIKRAAPIARAAAARWLHGFNMARLLLLCMMATACLGLRLPTPSPAAIGGALAACVVCASSPVPSLLAAEPATPPVPTAESSRMDNDPRRVDGNVKMVVATPEEAEKLRAAAEKLELPDVPVNSDLGKLLAGEGFPGSNSVQSPRAHSN